MASIQAGIIDHLAPHSRVVILRLRALGDCILSTPAIHLLKEYRPDLDIAVVADPRLAGIYSGNPDLAAVLPPSARAVRGFKPELCLNFHGGARSARLTLLSGARIRAGYDMLRFQWIYNTAIPTAQRILGEARPVHTAEHMASAIFYLGVPLKQVPAARIFPERGRSPAAPPGPYAVIHPWASRPDKTWPAGLFIELARAVRNSSGLEPLFIGGSHDNFAAFHGWRTIGGAPLTELARLIRDADLFIGNDSGPAHLAAALGTPEVVLFGSSDARTWAPWRTTATVLQARGPMESITPDQVLEAAASLRRVPK